MIASTSRNAIGAILCDFDGVIRLWPESDATRIEDAFQLPPGALAQAIFTPELLRQATTGAIPDEEWRGRIAEMLASDHGDDARGAVAAWSRLTGSVDDEMLALLRQARQTVPVVLLTNATSRLDRDLEALGLQETFDAIANSSALGVAKPDREIFLRAAGLVGVPITECVVIDDQPKHLETARTAGASVIHHTSVATTRDALSALRLSVDAPNVS